MTEKQLGNYIRAYRLKSGLSQHELGRLVGYQNGYQTARHERDLTAPPLLIALAYSAVFQVPVTAIFVGFQATVEATVGANLEEFMRQLRSAKDSESQPKDTMLKLQWLEERQRKQSTA